jgi:hypothetical protein
MMSKILGGAWRELADINSIRCDCGGWRSLLFVFLELDSIGVLHEEVSSR